MKLTKFPSFLASTLIAITAGSTLYALPPSENELQLKDRFVAARFDLDDALDENVQGLNVIANNDPVQKNSRETAKLRIANQVFEKGLYCHAPSEIEVILAKPAKRLTAVIGVDHNKGDNNGSVQFLVKVGDDVLYESGVMRGAEKGMPISVDFNEAKSFTLCINDGGDGNSCDQANWADAYVEFTDGSKVCLSDLPFINGFDRAYEAEYPFSFVYDGQSSRDFLSSWELNKTERDLGDNRTEKTLVFTSPDAKLQVTCVATIYNDFPNVEWIMTFKNIGKENTALLEKILPLDFNISQTSPKEFLLHHFNGTYVNRQDYMPLETIIDGQQPLKFTCSGGRATGACFPYYNFETDSNSGMIVVLGWSGKWNTEFTPLNQNHLHLSGGQTQTHFVLYPNEEVRTPTIVVQPWVRPNWIDAQNVWRAWMIKHIVPRSNGELISSFITACSSHQYAEMTKANTDSQILFIDRYLEEKIPLKYWWMDAGWYPCDGQWPRTGTWEVDKTRFPNGLREITDHGHAKGVGSIVWFEPERVAGDTWLTTEHPDWILGGKDGGLLNLGNPEVLDWAINHFDQIIKNEGLDWYRQDYNIDPLGAWKSNDTEDRAGITENHYVNGYLKYWDGLLERNPGLRIDSCASGGHRNDFETMRRAVPLLRSDCIFEPVSQQVHSYGLSFWVPFYGTGLRAFDDYTIRSSFVPYMIWCYDMRDKTLDYDQLRKHAKLWEECIAPNYDGDYYPLTDCDTKDNSWCGWQYNSPDKGIGVILMFRRSECIFMKGQFPLSGLEDDAVYEFKDFDTEKTWTATGKEMREQGLEIEIAARPGVATVSYKKQ